MSLLQFRGDYTSQMGEDGILVELFNRIPHQGWCCEVGAWDGWTFSNTRNFIEQGWKALLIEGDPEKFVELLNNRTNGEICHYGFIDDKVNTIDSVLEFHKIDHLDLLSLDIDGLDYYVLDTLKIRPSVIVVETSLVINPLQEDLVPRTTAKHIGQPVAAFAVWARENGYNTVAFTGNLFLVKNEFGIPDSEDLLGEYLQCPHFINHQKELRQQAFDHCVSNPYLILGDR